MTRNEDPRRPFGRLLSAMITPFHADGSLDVDGAARLATYMVDEQHNDGLVISGTTGESPTTTDAEKELLLRAVIEAVGDRAHIVAGVGTNDTRHTIELAAAAEKAGADGLLVVTPYYNKPPQAGLIAHFTAVADASGLPIAIYDIPHRAGVAIETETLVRLAEHPRIVAVKDAKDDVTATAWVTKRSDLAIYCGSDALTLPMLAIGAIGVVGTSTHFTGAGTQAMIEAYEAGDVRAATELHHRLLPLFTGIFRTQGVMLVKAGLSMLGLPSGPVRLPLVDASAAERDQLRADAAAAGVALPGAALVSQAHLELDPPPPLGAGALRVTPLGGLGAIGRNMTVFEYRRQAADRRLRGAVPGRRSARRRPDPAGLLVHHGPARRRPGDRAHARARGPHRRGAVPARAQDGHPAGRLEVHARAGRGEAVRAPDHAVHADRSGRTERADRPVRVRVLRGQPLDPGRARGRRQDRGRRGAAHRRLQDGPAAAGRPDHRPGRASPGSAARASTCCCPTRRTRRFPASSRPSGTSARCSTRSSRRRRAGSSWRRSRRTCTGCSR